MVTMFSVWVNAGYGIEKSGTVQLRMVLFAPIPSASRDDRCDGEAVARGATGSTRSGCPGAARLRLHFFFQLLQFLLRDDFSRRIDALRAGRAWQSADRASPCRWWSLAVQIGQQVHHRLAIFRVQVAVWARRPAGSMASRPGPAPRPRAAAGRRKLRRIVPSCGAPLLTRSSASFTRFLALRRRIPRGTSAATRRSLQPLDRDQIEASER